MSDFLRPGTSIIAPKSTDALKGCGIDADEVGGYITWSDPMDVSLRLWRVGKPDLFMVMSRGIFAANFKVPYNTLFAPKEIAGKHCDKRFPEDFLKSGYGWS